MAYPVNHLISLLYPRACHHLLRLWDLGSVSSMTSMVVAGGSVAASYFTASFLAEADLDTMSETSPLSSPAQQHVAVEWSCLASSVDLVNALTLLYSTHRTIKALYITVPKKETEGDRAVAAAGFSATILRSATRFQNLVYDNQDVHWSVVGKVIHAVLKQDAFWAAASTAYKMNRLATIKKRPALPAIHIASIAKTRNDVPAASAPLPRLSKKAMKRLQPAQVKATLAELANPTWQPPPMAPPSLLPDFRDAESARWV